MNLLLTDRECAFLAVLVKQQIQQQTALDANTAIDAALDLAIISSLEANQAMQNFFSDFDLPRLASIGERLLAAYDTSGKVVANETGVDKVEP